jgi:hypothetical protein
LANYVFKYNKLIRSDETSAANVDYTLVDPKLRVPPFAVKIDYTVDVDGRYPDPAVLIIDVT